MHWKRHIALLEGAPAELEALNLPADFKQGALKGMNETMGPTMDRIREFYQIEHEFFAEATALLTFMQKLQQEDGYVVNGDQIVFEYQEDVDEYNRRIEIIQQLAQREAQVQQAMRDQAQKQMERLEKYK